MKHLKSLISVLLVLAMMLAFVACDSKSKKKNDDDDDEKSEESSEISTNESSDDTSDTSFDDASADNTSSENTSSDDTTSEDTTSQPDDSIKLEGTLIYEDESVALSYVDIIVDDDGSLYLSVNAYNKTDEKVILSLEGFAIDDWSTNAFGEIEIAAETVSDELIDMYYYSEDIKSKADIGIITMSFAFYRDTDYETIVFIDPVTITVNEDNIFDVYNPGGTILYNQGGIFVSAEFVEYYDGYLDIYFYVENYSDTFIVCTDNFETDILLDDKPATAIFNISLMPTTKTLESMSFYALEEDGIGAFPSTLSFTMEIYDSFTYESIAIIPVELTLEY